MGKGDDPNCHAQGQVMLATDGLSLIARRPAANVWGLPSPSDTAAIMSRLGAALPDDPLQRRRVACDLAQQRLSRTPAGDPAAWRDAMHGYVCSRSGLTARLPDRVPFDREAPDNPGLVDGRLFIYAVIEDRGRPVGHALFAVSVGADGRTELRIGDVDLTRYLHAPDIGLPYQPPTDRYLGSGFVGGFLRHTESEARKLGVARASVNATNVGAVAWARLGFDWDPRPDADVYDSYEQALWTAATDQANAILTGLNQYAQEGKVPDHTPSAFRDWFEQLSEPPTPDQLVTWGSQHTVMGPRNRPMRAAAAAMLRKHAAWEGVKNLT